MALLMSVGFAVPVFYLCQMQGSFFVFWLAWLISLSDGIGESYILGMFHDVIVTNIDTKVHQAVTICGSMNPAKNVLVKLHVVIRSIPFAR